jgi:hypothetical protein
VGALCFSRGEQRFSVAEKSWTLICALALASKNPGLKPVLRNELLFRWTEVQLPPAKAGGSHQIRGG